MSANPFRYGGPVSGETFTGRRAELADIVSRIQDGINVVAMGPRRYGKTSLVLEAADRVQTSTGGGVAVVNVLAAAGDPARFAAQLARAVYALQGPWHRAESAAVSFMGRFRVRPTVTVDEHGPSFTFSGAEVAKNPGEVISDAYALLAEAARERPAALFVDEFQDIVGFGARLPELFKALADEHPSVALVIAGSQEHMLRDLTLDSRGALYGMMQPIRLGPIPVEEMGDFVQRRFHVAGKHIDRALADRIVALAGPVPNDIQHLAYDAFALTDAEASAGTVDAALRHAIANEAGTFVDTFARLTQGQRRVLVALAARPTGSPFAAEFVVGTGYGSASGVRKAIERLEDLALVTVRDGVYLVPNPFTRAWLEALQRDRQ